MLVTEDKGASTVSFCLKSPVMIKLVSIQGKMLWNMVKIVFWTLFLNFNKSPDYLIVNISTGVRNPKQNNN